MRKAQIDGNEVVLKKYWLTDSASRKVFTKEVGILTRLSHPNIANASGIVYDIKQAEAYLEMSVVKTLSSRESARGPSMGCFLAPSKGAG